MRHPKHEPMTPGGWSPAQAEDIAARLLKDLGQAWGFMTEPVRRAMVAREVLSVVLSNHRPAAPEAIAALLRETERRVGLE